MTPNEVLKKLNEMGINTSRSTLLRFEKAGLISEPKRGAGGRGQGRFTDYPDDTPEQFFASWRLLKDEKLSMEVLSQILKDGKTVYARELQVVDQELHVLDQDLQEISDEVFANDLEEYYDKMDEMFHGDIDAFKALLKFVTNSYDYEPEDLYRGKSLVEDWIYSNNEMVKNIGDRASQEKFLNERLFSEKQEQNIRARRLYYKWQNYYNGIKEKLSNILKKVETYEKTISYLEKENAQLREDIEKLKNKPE